MYKYNILMMRNSVLILILALLGLLPFLSTAQDFREMKIVHVLQEPRHRTVRQEGDVYLLDVQINPGDISFPHLHDSAMMFTFISSGQGPAYGRVSGETSYVERNFTHAVSNAGPNLLRILVMSNYGPGLTDLRSGRPTGISAEPGYENEWFRSYRISLQPGEETDSQTHFNPTVVIQVTEGKVHVSRADGIAEELAAMGDWRWRDPESAFTLKNMGTTEVEVVVNEARL